MSIYNLFFPKPKREELKPASGFTSVITDSFTWFCNKAISYQKVYNSMIALAVAYDAYNNPKAAMHEYMPDLIPHLLQVAVQRDQHFLIKLVGIELNLHRILTIVEHISTGESSIPLSLNLIDLLINHPLNIMSLGDYMLNAVPKQSYRPTMES